MAQNGIINMVQTIKEVHPDEVLLIKTGTFYNAYLKDAMILAYTCNYKIKKIESKYNVCGFPTTTINKVKLALEQRKINYRLLDRAHNYEEEENQNFNSKNMYGEEYKKAFKYLSTMNRIDTINAYLVENVNNENITNIITNIEKEINENK